MPKPAWLDKGSEPSEPAKEWPIWNKANLPPQFVIAVTRKRELDAQKSAIEKELGDKHHPGLNAQIEEMMGGALCEGAKVVGVGVTRLLTGRNESISKGKLLAAGVDPVLIENCTDFTSYNYVRIYPEKPKGPKPPAPASPNKVRGPA